MVSRDGEAFRLSEVAHAHVIEELSDALVVLFSHQPLARDFRGSDAASPQADSVRLHSGYIDDSDRLSFSDHLPQSKIVVLRATSTTTAQDVAARSDPFEVEFRQEPFSFLDMRFVRFKVGGQPYPVV